MVPRSPTAFFTVMVSLERRGPLRPLAISTIRTESLSTLIVNTSIYGWQYGIHGGKGSYNMAMGGNLQVKQFETNRRAKKNKYANIVLNIRINWRWINLGPIGLIKVRALPRTQLLDSARAPVSCPPSQLRVHTPDHHFFCSWTFS